MNSMDHKILDKTIEQHSDFIEERDKEFKLYLRKLADIFTEQIALEKEFKDQLNSLNKSFSDSITGIAPRFITKEEGKLLMNTYKTFFLYHENLTSLKNYADYISQLKDAFATCGVYEMYEESVPQFEAAKKDLDILAPFKNQVGK